jgi:hypothetical protein
MGELITGKVMDWLTAAKIGEIPLKDHAIPGNPDPSSQVRQPDSWVRGTKSTSNGLTFEPQETGCQNLSSETHQKMSKCE